MSKSKCSKYSQMTLQFHSTTPHLQLQYRILSTMRVNIRATTNNPLKMKMPSISKTVQTDMAVDLDIRQENHQAPLLATGAQIEKNTAMTARILKRRPNVPKTLLILPDI